MVSPRANDGTLPGDQRAGDDAGGRGFGAGVSRVATGEDERGAAGEGGDETRAVVLRVPGGSGAIGVRGNAWEQG